MRRGDERHAAKFGDGEVGWPYGARREDDQQPLPGEFMCGESGGECGAFGEPEFALAALQQFG